MFLCRFLPNELSLLAKAAGLTDTFNPAAFLLTPPLPIIRHAPRKRPCYLISLLGKHTDVVTVDKAHLHEHGWHIGIPQHAETWMCLDAAIDIAAVIRTKPPKQLVLDAACEPAALLSRGRARRPR